MTARIFSEDLTPDEITAIVGFDPTILHSRNVKARARSVRISNYWGWCSQSALHSDDPLKHVKSLIARFAPAREALDELRSRRCKTDVCGYIVNTGQGGPTLDIEAMQNLVTLGLPIWWDVYRGQAK